jgi:hypothetical protein
VTRCWRVDFSDRTKNEESEWIHSANQTAQSI